MIILAYHSLFVDGGDKKKYSIKRDAFYRQMAYLADNGFRAITVDDCLQRGQFAAKNKEILITFDDGHQSDYTIAYPILKNAGFVGTFFVTVNWIGLDGYLSRHQIDKMASGGMSIQSHGMTHAFLSDLGNEDLTNELNQSRSTLEQMLKKNVNCLSFPGGYYSKKVLMTARMLNFCGVCTSRPGVNKSCMKDPAFAVFDRFVITRETSFEDFKLIVQEAPQKIIMDRVLYATKNSAKKIMGSKRYYALWSRFFKEA